MRGVLVFLCVLTAGIASAQQSASFSVTESTFNAGGHPENGNVPSSASFRVSLDAIGDSVGAASVFGASFSIGGGFVDGFAPPVEVHDLVFVDATTLIWQPDGSVGDYALYRGTVGAPFDPGFGACDQPPPSLTGATAVAPLLPPPGETHFYLVTARNRLGEESSKGAGRANPAPCP